jgi:recombination protein RecR
MSDLTALEALKQALRRLPGVGPKSAQRMAFYLLERDRDGARRIADALTHALNRIVHCERCNNLSESPLCSICSSSRRDRSLLCIIESPSDLLSIEQSGVYQGLYFVLMGRLSPLDGIGPDEIGVPRIEKILAEGEVKEVVLATNLTVEGEATAHYLSDLIRARGVRASRIAYGVPIGGELEYTDRNTLARALAGRRDV